MTAPISRPTQFTDGSLVARWTTIALLCAVVLAVSIRGRIVGLPNRETAKQTAVEEPASIAESNPLPEVPLIAAPDFLEPLPVIELTEDQSAVAELPIEAELTPPPPVLEASLPVVKESLKLEEPPSEPLPPVEVVPVEVVESEGPELAIPIEASEPIPHESAPVVDILPIVEEVEPTEPIETVEPTDEPQKPQEYDDEDAESAAQLTPEDLLTFSPSVAEISQKLLPEVQAAYQLSQHGATHAAHGRFVQVLRRIAQAKDVEEMTEKYTRSLNEGLRALDEADDFMPACGSPALDLDAVASTHQTPMLKVHQSRYTLPHEAVALYHRYAQQKLGAAVTGEQAGSMALHGLGKIHARWAETENDSLIAMRHSMTMYRAALVAHPRNHLAANELGVMLARSGRYDQAAVPLEWAAQLAGTATIYHNLSIVQQNRGQTALAAAAKSQADRLAMLERTSGEVSRRHGVQWVAPQDFARISDAHMASPQQSSAVAEQPSQPAPPTASRQSTVTPAPRGGTWR